MSPWKWWIAVAGINLTPRGVALLHGDRGAIDDESGTFDARRSSSGISTRVSWRWVHRGRGHRGRDLGYRGRNLRRCGAWLPVGRSRDLGLGSDRAPSRNMAHVIRDTARSSSGYTWHFGQPWSRVPTASTISARPTSTLRQQRSYPGLCTQVRGTGILRSSRGPAPMLSCILMYKVGDFRPSAYTINR